LGGDLVGRDGTQTQSLIETNKERRGFAEREESWQKIKAKEKRLSEGKMEGKESQLPVVVESFFLCLGFVGRAKQNKINRLETAEFRRKAGRSFFYLVYIKS